MRALAACLMTACTAAPAADARISRGERRIAKRINLLRAQHGLAKVRADRRLARAADAHSRDMLRKDFFAHNSSNGSSASARVRRYRHANLIGETLAFMPSGGRTSARAIVNMWTRSPVHLQVLTTARFRRIGVSKRRGRLSGRKVTVWTVDLSSRR
jgi:uncharacterized protein YkwD